MHAHQADAIVDDLAGYVERPKLARNGKFNPRFALIQTYAESLFRSPSRADGPYPKRPFRNGTPNITNETPAGFLER